MKEKEVIKEIKKYWDQHGWYVIRNQQNICSHKGLADFLVIRNGIHIFVEAKGEKGRQSPMQKQFQDDIEKVGSDYVLCKSVEDFEKYAHQAIMYRRYM